MGAAQDYFHYLIALETILTDLSASALLPASLMCCLTSSCIMRRCAVIAFYLRFDCSQRKSHHQVAANVGKTTDGEVSVESVVLKSDMLTM